jgi:hypothetical protein
MCRLVAGLAVAVLAVLVAPVTTAQAASAPVHERGQGWVLPAAASVHGNRVFTSYGCHHGASRFGTYKMSGGVTVNGDQSAWTFEVAITEKGALHKASKVHFASYSSKSARKQVLRVFKQTRYHYLAENGQEFIQGVWHGGQQQELQAFNPRKKGC